MCVYYVKDCGVFVGDWASHNIKQNSGIHNIYSQFRYLGHLHVKQTNQEMISK